jgi:hypothetical protein
MNAMKRLPVQARIALLEGWVRNLGRKNAAGRLARKIFRSVISSTTPVVGKRIKCHAISLGNLAAYLASQKVGPPFKCYASPYRRTRQTIQIANRLRRIDGLKSKILPAIPKTAGASSVMVRGFTKSKVLETTIAHSLGGPEAWHATHLIPIVRKHLLDTLQDRVLIQVFHQAGNEPNWQLKIERLEDDRSMNPDSVTLSYGLTIGDKPNKPRHEQGHTWQLDNRRFWESISKAMIRLHGQKSKDASLWIELRWHR